MNYIAAIDIGGTNIKYGIVSSEGEVLISRETSTEAKKGGQALMAKVISLVDELKKESFEIDGIGVSSAGQIEPKEGYCIFASEALPGWTGMKIKKNLQEVFKLPVTVENDVNAAALGEKWKGAGEKVDDFLCLTVGTGIGGAIVQKGEINYGSTGSAAEFGHTTLYPDGKPCTCGQNGCLERYAATSVLVENVTKRKNLSEPIDGKEIFELAQKGDEICKEEIDELVKNLAIGLKNLTHMFNPSLIVLGGGISEQGKPFMKKIEDKLKEYIMPSYRNVQLKETQCGNRAGMLGAAYRTWMEELSKEKGKTCISRVADKCNEKVKPELKNR